MQLSRVTSLLLSAVYAACALPPLVGGLLALVATVVPLHQEGAVWHSMLSASLLFFLAAVAFSAASVGVFRERKWARWPSLFITLLALGLVAQILPEALYMQRASSQGGELPTGAQASQLFSTLVQYYAARVAFVVLSALATIYVFLRRE